MMTRYYRSMERHEEQGFFLLQIPRFRLDADKNADGLDCGIDIFA